MISGIDRNDYQRFENWLPPRARQVIPERHHLQVACVIAQRGQSKNWVANVYRHVKGKQYKVL